MRHSYLLLCYRGRIVGARDDPGTHVAIHLLSSFLRGVDLLARNESIEIVASVGYTSMDINGSTEEGGLARKVASVDHS